jgi:predicted helicase
MSMYAHRDVANTCENPDVKYLRIHEFWFSCLDVAYTGKLIPFRTLVKGLEEELNSDLSRLGLWYDDLRRLLAHIKLTIQQVEMPDFHELYESFLSIYDPETRFDYGAFYTPRYLAYFITEFSRRIVENSIEGVNFYEDSHRIIDPCCGTGTFIEAILEKLLPSNSSNIVGLEILPVPYALAHYRMNMLRDGYPENVNIILTNTLSDNLFIENKDDVGKETLSNMLLREQKSAYNLTTPPITLIIGNPPSSDSKFEVDNEGDFLKVLINDFRPPAADRTARQNTQKQLSNEFIKFLRWCVDRALNSVPSLFALILPSSFGKHPSYKYARKYLTDHFNELWVLDFDSDNRTGIAVSSLFQTRQGRLLLVGVITSSGSGTAIIKYHSINEYSRAEKVSYLKNTEIDLTRFETLEVDTDNYALKPTALYDKEAYSKFWPLSNRSNSGIFYRHCSSIKLAPTHLLVHASPGQLKRRSKFIARSENNYELIEERWYTGQRKPPPQSKITPDVKDKLLKAVQSNDIHNYSYRPFIQTSVILNDALLSELQKLGGGGTRDRPEIRAAYSDNKVLGFAVSPSPEDIGASIHKFSSFCWNIPDNDLSARGNAHIFCNYFPEYKKKKNWDPTLRENINQELVNQLCSDFDLNTESAHEKLMFYVYAVLSSEFYIQSFAGKLFTVSGEWPRIPITKDKTAFIAIATIGKTLAEIEIKHEKLPDENPAEATIVYYKYKVEKDRLILLDDTRSVLKEFPNIPEEITGFTVSGYNILREWLKMHSFPYYRKGVGTTEFLKLEKLIDNISEYLDAIVELDSIVEEILDGELYEP